MLGRILAAQPGDLAGLIALLDGLRAMLPAMASRAAVHDQAASFPAEDLDGLRAAGILAAVLPECEGGLGLGTEPHGAAGLAMLLRLLGRGNMAVGRLFEAHVNAVRLIARYGTRQQLRAAARDVRAGALFGLWVTDPVEHALCAVADGRLSGGKAFCSGAGHVQQAVVTVRDSAGRIRLATVSTAGAAATRLPFQMQGMRAAQTGLVSFDGLHIGAENWVGQAGDYMAEPDFSAGAWRTSAVTCGGLEAFLADAMQNLRDRGRADDPHQRARMGRAWIAQETALLWLDRVAVIAEQAYAEQAYAEQGVAEQGGGRTATQGIVAEVGLARMAIEAACREVMQLVERSLGLAAVLQPGTVERIGRDLATYLCQPAGDEVLGKAAAHVMQARCR